MHEDLFFETSGEFFGVWEAVKPVVPAFRERFQNKQILAHLEQAAKRYEAWQEKRNPGHVAAMRQFIQHVALAGSLSSQGLTWAGNQLQVADASGVPPS
jgi:hypothetical protein